jgi:hypothetical protein
VEETRGIAKMLLALARSLQLPNTEH